MYAVQQAQNLDAITQVVAKTEARANELAAKLGEAQQANDAMALRAFELARERKALEERVTELESVAGKILAAQPEAIVDALTRWLKNDHKALAKALTEFLGEVVAHG